MRAAALTLVTLLGIFTSVRAQEPLHQQIDKLVLTRGGKHPVAPVADDYEFVRRVYLDLAGRIPAATETRAFVLDRAADKRVKLIDKLLASPEYVRALSDAFDIMLMERVGDNPDWSAWLRASF